MKIEEFFEKINAPTITRNAIQRHTRIETVEELQEYCCTDLLKLPSFGRKSLDIIEEGLHSLGFDSMESYNPNGPFGRHYLKIDTPQDNLLKTRIKDLLELKNMLHKDLLKIEKKIEKLEEQIQHKGETL